MQVEKNERIISLDLVRALAILHIICFHIYGPLGLAYNFGMYHERHVQFTIFMKIMNYVFYLLFDNGSISVYVFILLSGFSLAVHYKPEQNLVSFYKRRLEKILFPFYNVFFFEIIFQTIIKFFLSAKMNSMLGKQTPVQSFIMSFNLHTILIAFTFPFLFDFSGYYLRQINDSLWYMPLIIECYLLFPLLFKVCKKIGIKKFNILASLGNVFYLAFCILILHLKQNGFRSVDNVAIRLFPAYMSAFYFGIGLGIQFTQQKKFIVAKKYLLLSCIIFPLLLFFKTTPIFEILFYPIEGIALFYIFYLLTTKILTIRSLTYFLQQIAKKSYSLYLFHVPLINPFLYFSYFLLKLFPHSFLWVLSLESFILFLPILYFITLFIDKLNMSRRIYAFCSPFFKL